MVSESDRLSATALTVSLIALVIALGQFLLSIFGTAEGYRRCRKEVIGAWAACTKRRWLLYEFRFETRFVTPEIDLLTPSTVKEKICKGGKGPYYLVNEDPKNATDEIRGTVGPKDEDFRDNELLVTWIPFLRAIHDAHYSWRAAPRSIPSNTPTEAEIEQDSGSEEKSDADDGSRPRAKRRLPLQPTDIVITYKGMSWDFMPPEVVRPLAITHLSALIKMSSRLGMQWQQLDPTKDEGIRAAGNGYYLNANTIRGLGITVRFSADVGKRGSSKLIPNEATDMMLCGILPGVPELDIQPHPLIGDNKVVSMVRNVLDDLRVPSKDREDLDLADFRRRMAWWDGNFRRQAFNDVIVLLCPWMLLDGVDCRTVSFTGWLGMQPCTVFVYWESRIMLLAELNKRIGENKELVDPESWLLKVHEIIDKLERQFPDTFYGANDRHGRQGVQGTVPDLINTCKEGFDATTRFFVQLQDDPKPSRPPLTYKDLVGAHCSTALRASLDARKKTNSASKPPSLYVDKFKRWPRIHDDVRDIQNWPAKSLGDAAWNYVQHLPTFYGDVRGRLERTGDLEKSGGYTDKELEEVWWMLMLRGLCWTLPIHLRGLDAVIPSSYCDNRTPIWIL
jgi:hypothetical protein